MRKRNVLGKSATEANGSLSSPLATLKASVQQKDASGTSRQWSRKKYVRASSAGKSRGTTSHSRRRMPSPVSLWTFESVIIYVQRNLLLLAFNMHKPFQIRPSSVSRGMRCQCVFPSEERKQSSTCTFWPHSVLDSIEKLSVISTKCVVFHNKIRKK